MREYPSLHPSNLVGDNEENRFEIFDVRNY